MQSSSQRRFPSRGQQSYLKAENAWGLPFHIPILQLHFTSLHRFLRLISARGVLNFLVATSPTTSSQYCWTFSPYSMFSKRQSRIVSGIRGTHRLEGSESIDLMMWNCCFFREQVMTWASLGCASHALKIHMDRWTNFSIFDKQWGLLGKGKLGIF